MKQMNERTVIFGLDGFTWKQTASGLLRIRQRTSKNGPRETFSLLLSLSYLVCVHAPETDFHRALISAWEAHKRAVIYHASRQQPTLTTLTTREKKEIAQINPPPQKKSNGQPTCALFSPSCLIGTVSCANNHFVFYSWIQRAYFKWYSPFFSVNIARRWCNSRRYLK